MTREIACLTYWSDTIQMKNDVQQVGSQIMSGTRSHSASKPMTTHHIDDVFTRN